MRSWSLRYSNIVTIRFFTFIPYDLGEGIESQHQQATRGFGEESPVIGIRLFAEDEEVVEYTKIHSDSQRQHLQTMAKNLGKFTKALDEHGKPLKLYEHCIVLQMMLITAESLEYYKDPDQKKTLGDKVKELLRTLLQENNLDFSDVDEIKIDISEEDIQKTNKFFKIGKCHSWYLNTVIILI